MKSLRANKPVLLLKSMGPLKEYRTHFEHVKLQAFAVGMCVCVWGGSPVYSVKGLSSGKCSIAQKNLYSRFSKQD